MNTTSSIYLIPCNLGESSIDPIPQYAKTIIYELNIFFVENERSARRYLRSIGYTKNFDDVTLILLDKQQEGKNIKQHLQQIKKKGESAGILSEAGLPGIADPGTQVVKLAHSLFFKVQPLVGPSSILLALVASGLNGQSFCFHGYLPIETPAQIKKIKELETQSARFGTTQIFIETPYRNNKIIENILSSCMPDTKLCIACDITLDTEFIQTKSMKEWKEQTPDIHKRPAIFLINM
ncbi:MAG: SAM-dependent methyltransferase [Bacteroidota bacterium]